MLLTADYAKLPQLFRPQSEAGAHFLAQELAYETWGFAFAWIYRQGITQDRPWLIQGIRFGIAAALISSVPMYLIYYVVQPMDLSTVIKQILGDAVTLVICGIAVAFINRSADESTARSTATP